MVAMDIEKARTVCAEYNQSHLLRFWDELNEVEQEQLLHDIEDVDFAALNKSYKDAMKTLESSGEKVDDKMKPIPPEHCGHVTTSTADEIDQYRSDGLEAVGDGRVGVLLLAGGQGTRLGVSYPKGMYNVGLPSGSPLYKLQAERIVRLQKSAAAKTDKHGKIIWYIMTSEHTKEPTEEFFKANNYFGLDEKHVVMFEQGTLPCLEFNGNLILSTKSRLSKAPDGNGGLYRALRKQGILEDMQRRGIDLIHAYCVDNILVKMADPVFLGFCMSKNADCGAKVLEKAYPTEPVGVVCEVDGKFQVVEYSEITEKTACLTNADGSLVYNSGNICNHFFTLEFLKRIVSENESQLPYHVAKKKIPYVDDKGNQQKPSSPNGIKLEKFVFDVFQFSRQLAVWDVRRCEEFSPLKNADGAAKDTPTTSREALLQLHTQWVLDAGGSFRLPSGDLIEDGVIGVEEVVPCEVSPLISYSGEGLREIVEGKTLSTPVYIRLKGDKPVICEKVSNNNL